MIKLEPKPPLLRTLLADRPVAGRAWVLALLAPLVLVGAERRWPVRHQPSRPLYTLLRRAAPRRAPPSFPVG